MAIMYGGDYDYDYGDDDSGDHTWRWLIIQGDDDW